MKPNITITATTATSSTNASTNITANSAIPAFLLPQQLLTGPPILPRKLLLR